MKMQPGPLILRQEPAGQAMRMVASRLCAMCVFGGTSTAPPNVMLWAITRRDLALSPPYRATKFLPNLFRLAPPQYIPPSAIAGIKTYTPPISSSQAYRCVVAQHLAPHTNCINGPQATPKHDG